MKNMKLKFLLKLLARTVNSLNKRGINITAYLDEDSSSEKLIKDFNEFYEKEVSKIKIENRISSVRVFGGRKLC